ncbi:MAG TPA: dipeptide epimerase [Puia sp.]|nr:dipeptide epimerase [Puia sp.]
MKIRCWTYNLPFKHPFTISKGTKTHQPSLIVEIEQFGLKGYGEAPAIAYYGIPVEKMLHDLVVVRSKIERFAYTEPKRFWHFLHHLIPANSFLACALDMASWDLYGKLRNEPLYRLWKTQFGHNVLTDYTIGIDTPERMKHKIKELEWPIYKIKLGTNHDIDILQSLRAATDAVIRVDANAGWDLKKALFMLNQLQKLRIELIEQPLGKDDWTNMQILKEQSGIPLIADESCVGPKDLEKCAESFHGINIKLTKCGGITPALDMIISARNLGLQVMMGSMNESSVGSAAIAQFLPQLDYVDMDGPLLLASDIATGLSFDRGTVKISERPGLGIEFAEGSQPFMDYLH